MPEYLNVIECSKWFFQVCAISPLIFLFYLIKEVLFPWL